MAEKLNMMTKDMAKENLQKLMELFPNIVTESIDADGKAIFAIDKDKLQQEINACVVDGKEQRYQFTWPDKNQAVIAANAPSTNTLRPCREESVNFDTTQNLYIEGDNLEVLKLLQENYLGKVKMIYIDPPYNTGNDFVYEDDFAESTEEFMAKSGQFDDEGNRLVANTDSNGRFHTDWLNMMYSRLRISRNLLTNDGVIFISIDENELENLLILCNEIFGKRNIDTIIWQKQDSKVDKNTNAKVINRFKSIHETLVICYKDKKSTLFNKMLRLPDWKGEQKNIDNDPRGNWQSGIISFEEGHEKEDRSSEFYYTVQSPSGKIWTRHWFVTKEEMDILLKENRIYFGKAPEYTNVPRLKTFEKEEKEYYLESIMRGVGTSSSAKDEIAEIFGNRDIFDTPKPVKLIKELIRCTSYKDSVILDFFSGSATTAQAVCELNVEDKGKRKFILVQIPEVIKSESVAYKTGYHTICDIGKFRLKQLSNNLTSIDTGFRVLKLDTTNMQSVYYTPSQYIQNANLFEQSWDNVKPDRTHEDLLFQAMLELNCALSAPIEKKELAGKQVFDVDNNYILACFDENLDDAAITAIAKLKPSFFVMRDSSQADDSVAVNFEQIFNTYSPDTVLKVF